ncbi:DUF3237 domain-containing protein [Microbacterium radiodurans]|uniref:UPF0311 protein F6B42_11010 n=1 Tax=Microbacterium radiodurans TaxID=661398 RepID=A0A5J5IRG4_9MICO|nr:DUF3237 domain-containing protein [Microbacterium radiodurans]KAA9085031.1 DUF3237 domain-containing protein [Microbacterium radiodurans]
MMVRPTTPGLEPAFEVRVDLGPPDDYGTTRVGHRRVVPIVGGAVSGGLDAEIVPGGADWQILRDDGAIEIDCRYSARTAAGELLYLQVSGVRSGDPAVLDALLRGEPVDPGDYYFRTAIRIETSAPRWAELQRSVYVASAVREANTVRFTAYRVS